MRLPATLTALLALLLPARVSAATSKRGLVFTPNATHPSDNYIWARDPSLLTWYYNYGPSPSPAFSNVTQERFEFVPMLWGAPADLADTSFLTTVKTLVTAKGLDIKHVMSFNEPDGPPEWGGSNILPEVAARVWVSNIAPLRDMGIKVGLPACTGGWGGVPWLRQFLGNCSRIVSAGGETRNCSYDFVPIHWYGDFGAFASHIGTYAAAFPGSPIWVTEYNYNDQSLEATQQFYNQSSEYMDRIDDVERYSLFAAFRSDVSNVGPNATMLSAGGQLTDIGAWYLGRPATGVLPQQGAAGRAWNDGAARYAAAMAVVAAVALVGL